MTFVEVLFYGWYGDVSELKTKMTKLFQPVDEKL